MNDLKPRSDKLTILRLLLLTAGVAVGLRIFERVLRNWDSSSVESWRFGVTAILGGCSLPGPFFAIARRRSGARLRAGGMLWMTLGLGVWMLLPPALVGGTSAAQVFVYYALPLIALSAMLAASAAGRLNRRSLGRSAPWVERFGLYLGFAWVPLGVWVLVDIYREAFW